MMGQACSQAFAMAGYEVRLQSLDDELFRGVRDRIRHDLEFIAERGVGSPEEVDGTVSLITTTSDLAEAVDGADFVLECIFENLEAKRTLFRQMEALVRPGGRSWRPIRRSSGSSEIAEACSLPGRVVGAHWWTPAYLMPIVEIIPGEKTTQETVDRATRLMAEAGKLPVHVKKDAPGVRRQPPAARALSRGHVHRRPGHRRPGDGRPGAQVRAGRPLPGDGAVRAHGHGRPGSGRRRRGLPLAAPGRQPRGVPACCRTRWLEASSGFKSGGVGFYTWTPEEQKAFRENLLDHLARQAAAGRVRQGPHGARGSPDPRPLSFPRGRLAVRTITGGVVTRRKATGLNSLRTGACIRCYNITVR